MPSFKDNSITCLPEEMPYEMINGAFISSGVSLGKNTRIFPGAFGGVTKDLGEGCIVKGNPAK